MKYPLAEHQAVLKRLIISVAMCLLMFVQVVFAQTETVDTFPVEQRCITEPTQPPSDWTYPGMILMSGYAGIHAMQADWETPHIVAQFTMDEQGNAPIDGGQISPDQNWYAAPMGEVFYEETFNNFWIVRELRVYSLSDERKAFTLDLTNYQNSLSGFTAWGFSPINWRDNLSLMIGGLLIHPFEPVITDSEPSDTDYYSAIDYFPSPRVISPDLSRAYGSYNYSSSVGVLEAPTSILGVHDLTNSTPLASLSQLSHVSWRRDSSGFMARMQEQDQNWHGFVYFDQDGNLIDHIMQVDSYSNDSIRVSGRSELQWSPDDRYFAFVITSYPDPKRLMLVDWQDRIVIDTCLRPLNAPVWSPDGSMFTYLTNARENLNLVVVDITTWQAYIVARHSGARAFFGATEMVGWRSTPNDQ